MAFTRRDLQYSHYSWRTTEGDSSRIRGFPDNVLLNRNEGYEVVHFINQFIADQVSWRTESEASKLALGHKIERMIHNNLPGNVRSHLNVQQWIATNWANY